MKKRNPENKTPMSVEEKKRLIFLGVVAAFLLAVLLVLVFVFMPGNDIPELNTTAPTPTQTTAPTQTDPGTTGQTEPSTEETTAPTEPTESLMLQELRRVLNSSSRSSAAFPMRVTGLLLLFTP